MCPVALDSAVRFKLNDQSMHGHAKHACRTDKVPTTNHRIHIQHYGVEHFRSPQKFQPLAWLLINLPRWCWHRRTVLTCVASLENHVPGLHCLEARMPPLEGCIVSLFPGARLAEGFHPGHDRLRIAWARNSEDSVAIHNSLPYSLRMLTSLLTLSFIHSFIH
jgi:hypothetical protein